MSYARRFHHVGITVADLDTVTAFFVGLGLEVEGRTFVEGEFLDTVIGIPDSRTEIVMLRPPNGGTGLELSSFVRPDHEPGSPAAMANELGIRNVAFEVEDLQAAVDRLATDGYGLVGGIGQYEHIWRMAYVRGPEGSSCLWPSASADAAATRDQPDDLVLVDRYSAGADTDLRGAEDDRGIRRGARAAGETVGARHPCALRTCQGCAHRQGRP